MWLYLQVFLAEGCLDQVGTIGLRYRVGSIVQWSSKSFVRSYIWLCPRRHTCVNVRSSLISKGRLLVFLLLPGEKSKFSLPYYVRGRAKFSLIWLKLKPAKSRKKIEGSTRTQRLIWISLSRDSLLAFRKTRHLYSSQDKPNQ